MSATRTTQSSPEIAEGLSATLVGGGIVTMALFPLALPALLLTAVAVLPFLLLPLAAGLLVAAVALPILAVRSLTRRAIRALRPCVPEPQPGAMPC